MVAPPVTMMMKKLPGGGRRRALCTKAPRPAAPAVNRAASSSHQWLSCAHTTEPTSAPATEPPTSSSPAVPMTRQRVRQECPSP